MSYILKALRRAYDSAKFKAVSVYKGQYYSAFESAMAFNSNFKKKQKVKLRYQNYPELDKFFMQFLNSAQTNGRINGQNLAFLVGAQSIGKTSYVENNLEKFKQLKQSFADKSKKIELPQIHRYKSPQYIQNQTKQTIFDNEHYLVFNFNFKKNRAVNFQTFLQDIHEQIIQQIVKLSTKLKEGMINSQIIKEVLLAENAPQYLYIYLKDVIYCIINDLDSIVLSQKGKEQLGLINDSINGLKVQSRQFFRIGDSYYKKVIDVVSKDLKIGETEAALRLFLSVGRRIQYQNRPQPYLYSFYSTGIESTNTLFDILNHICGVGKLNKQIFERYYFNQTFTTDQSFDPNRIKFQQSLIKNNIRVDVAMFFLNMEELYFYGSPQFWNFIDHIISRTCHSSGLRTHFPILIEFPNYSDFSNVHDMGQFNLGSPVVIELPGYTLHQILLSNANVAHLFTEKILIPLFYSLGRNPSSWNKALIEMSNGNAKVQDIIKLSAKYIQMEGIKVQAKINSIFTHQEILPQLCDNSARYELIQHLRLIKKGRGLLQTHLPGIHIDFFTRPIFRLLLKENLLYEHYYLPNMDITQQTWSLKLNDIKNQLLRNNHWHFLQWRWRNKHRFNIFFKDVRLDKRSQKQSYDLDEFRKRRTQPLLAQTYYGAKFSYIFHYSERGIEADLFF